MFLMRRVAWTPGLPSPSVAPDCGLGRPLPLCASVPPSARGPPFPSSARTDMWLQRDFALGMEKVAQGDLEWAQHSPPGFCPGSTSYLRGRLWGRSESKLLGRGKPRPQCGDQRWTEALGQGQAGGGSVNILCTYPGILATCPRAVH